jgi:hypothetical protein
MASDKIWEKHDLIFKFLANPKSEAKSVTEWAIIDPDHLKIVLSQLEYSAAELIRWSTQTTTPLTHSQLKTHAATAIKKFGSLELARKFWIQRSERMFQARSELKISLNKKLLAQDLILPWLEAV